MSLSYWEITSKGHRKDFLA